MLVDVATGEEVATAVYEYANGVIDRELPGTGEPLPPDTALQDPADYLRTLEVTIPQVMRESGVEPEQVIGIGIDFTACTMLPVKADGTPLCFLEEYRANPHSWVKLWKHHSAQPYANRLNAIARERGETFLCRYGGKISSEWFFPKAWQILDEAPEIYEAADRLIEAADWVIWQLTGVETPQRVHGGVQGHLEQAGGLSEPGVFCGAGSRAWPTSSMRRCPAPSCRREPGPGGSRRGMAEKLGLKPGTAVAVANVDAHVAVPAATVVTPNKMVMVMGTSICHLVLGERAAGGGRHVRGGGGRDPARLLRL